MFLSREMHTVLKKFLQIEESQGKYTMNVKTLVALAVEVWCVYGAPILPLTNTIGFD